MNMGKKIALKDYEIHYYEVDYRRKMLITALIDFLGDIATWQSEELGIGIDYLISQGLGWVLYKWDINIYKYPLYGEKITIRTYPYGFRRFYAYRKFEVLNGQGEIIGTADSIWFLLNIEKKKPVRIDGSMYDAYGIEENCKDTIEIEDIIKPEKIDYEKVFNVRYGDIDTNMHVNNAKYAAWAIEAVPVDIVQSSILTNIRITYQKETRYGEMVKSKVQVIPQEEDLICLHLIEDNEGNELTRIETHWKKYEENPSAL